LKALNLSRVTTSAMHHEEIDLSAFARAIVGSAENYSSRKWSHLFALSSDLAVVVCRKFEKLCLLAVLFTSPEERKPCEQLSSHFLLHV